MIKNIGTLAGQVWEALHANNGMLTVNQIKRDLRITDFDLFLAVGWLAREDKLECIGEVLALKQ